jgi:potassium-transporting ATPase KdpC subunit
MIEHLRPAVVMLLLFTLLTGLAYPLAVTGIAQVALYHPANGSLISKDGQVIGSALIGQSFVSDRYFHGRPSATSAPDPKDDTKTIDAPYNAANSSGSNLGPLSVKLIDRVKAGATALKAESGLEVIPADAVTTSGSGLDPHISPAFAKAQVARVANARRLPEDTVRSLVARLTEQPRFGFVGEERINVLALNMALDTMAPVTLSSP